LFGAGEWKTENGGGYGGALDELTAAKHVPPPERGNAPESNRKAGGG
jgi:hypothetical protein